MPCAFCEIVAGRSPARVVHQDERIVAFHDLHPQAPTHVLLVPRRHVASLLDLAPDDDPVVGAMIRTARDLAARLGFGGRGFRLVFNAGPDAGYSVHHIHLHLLGGRRLGWPPG
ncbi:MAG TPA: histidine triad nucleotide-binding protein [Vicinamibacteria bacterium]|nr:histidine triad nucleotide-binding protein [Vicinamibacteria bacterium]